MKKLLGIIPNPIFIFSVVAVAIVSAFYVASQWYYSRWDATLLGFKDNAPAALTYVAEHLSQFSDSYIGADDPASRSPELVKKIEAFESLIMDHPLVHYQTDSINTLERQFKAAHGGRKTELAWDIIDQFDHAHDFMIELTKMYFRDQLPFEKDSTEHQFIGKMVNTYRRFVEETDDPFGAEAFAKLQQRIEQEERKRTSDPEWIRQENEYKETLTLAEQIQSEIEMFKHENPGLLSPVADVPWIMPAPSSVDSDSDAAFSESTSQPFDVEDSLNDSLNAGVAEPGIDGEASYLTDNESEVNTDKKQATPLSPERFDQAQQLIDQYGTEEGLRRLRASDPEAARRFESVPRPGRDRRNPPARDTSDDAASTQ